MSTSARQLPTSASGADAALRVIVPDRTPAREEVPTRRAAPQTGPATERRREAGLVTEAQGLHPEDAPRKARAKDRTRPDLEPADLRGCPTADGPSACTVARSGPRTGSRDGGTGRQEETTRDAGGRDMGDEAGERALRLIAATLRTLATGGVRPTSVPAMKIANRIERTITR